MQFVYNECGNETFNKTTIINNEEISRFYVCILNFLCISRKQKTSVSVFLGTGWFNVRTASGWTHHTRRHKSKQLPIPLLLHTECWQRSNESSSPTEVGHKATGHCLAVLGSWHRPFHCVGITERDIRGVAPTHSSVEPSTSPSSSPGAGNGSNRKPQQASGSETHQWPPRWPGVGPGLSHRGSQVHATLITPAETMSGNDA